VIITVVGNFTSVMQIIDQLLFELNYCSWN